MKTLASNLCFSLAALALIAAPLLHAETVLIDTKFEQKDDSSKPIAIPKDNAAIPLITPTALVEFAASSPANPSTLRVAKDAIDSITPPYLIMYIGTRVAPADAPANSGVVWNLSSSMISQGVFKVSFDATADQTDKTGGRFLVTFKSASGKSPNAHPGLTPVSLLFSNTGAITIGAAPKGTSTLNYQADRLQHFEMQIDLDKQVWSLKIDTLEVVKEASLADYLKTAGDGPFNITDVSFTSEGGWGAQPNATFILKNVKATLIVPLPGKK